MNPEPTTIPLWAQIAALLLPIGVSFITLVIQSRQNELNRRKWVEAERGKAESESSESAANASKSFAEAAETYADLVKDLQKKVADLTERVVVSEAKITEQANKITVQEAKIERQDRVITELQAENIDLKEWAEALVKQIKGIDRDTIPVAFRRRNELR